MEPHGSAELFDLLVKNANGLAIFTLDADGRVATWNVSAKKLLGYEEHEIIGQPADVFFTAEDRARKEPEKNSRRRRKWARRAMIVGSCGRISLGFGAAG